MKELKKYLDYVGPYKVEQINCPHFKNPIDRSKPPAGVLHTTEGGWDGSMGVFKSHFAPHLILGYNAHYVTAKRLYHDNHPAIQKGPTGHVEIAQLVPFGVIGAALVHDNDEAICQIEMIGNSKVNPWLPDPETLDLLARAMLTLRDEFGIPLSHPWPDGDWGRSGPNAHRSSGKFGKVAGWFGHQDIPSPDTHWDPGNLSWSKIFEHAASIDDKSTTNTVIAGK